jgi:hypothetical protein
MLHLIKVTQNQYPLQGCSRQGRTKAGDCDGLNVGTRCHQLGGWWSSLHLVRHRYHKCNARSLNLHRRGLSTTGKKKIFFIQSISTINFSFITGVVRTEETLEFAIGRSSNDGNDQRPTAFNIVTWDAISRCQCYKSNHKFQS